MKLLVVINAKFQCIKRRKGVDKVFFSINHIEPVLAVEHIGYLLNTSEKSLYFSWLDTFRERGIIDRYELPYINTLLDEMDFLKRHSCQGVLSLLLLMILGLLTLHGCDVVNLISFVPLYIIFEIHYSLSTNMPLIDQTGALIGTPLYTSYFA